MLFRRARSGLVLIAVFWLWMFFGAADFVAALFGSPIHAALAVFALGAVTLISLLFLPICVAYLMLNRPRAQAKAPAALQQAREAHGNGLAPVIRMMPRRAAARRAALSGRAAVRGAALTSRAAAKWRDLAS